MSYSSLIGFSSTDQYDGSITTEECEWKAVTNKMKQKYYSSKDENDQDNLMSVLQNRWVKMKVSVNIIIIYLLYAAYYSK
jgi:hypothetical protein